MILDKTTSATRASKIEGEKEGDDQLETIMSYCQKWVQTTDVAAGITSINRSGQ